MLQILARPPEMPIGISRSRAVEALRRAALELGLGHSVVALVTHLVMLTEETDWRPEARPIAWPSNVELSAELELSKTRLKELVRAALEEGLLTIESGPSGKRFGRRGASGDIVEAYGFNLAPLAARTPALEAMAEARSKRLREAADLRKRIGQAARIVMLMAQNAGYQRLTNFDWNAAFAEAGTISRRALEPPLSGRPEKLTQSLARLEELTAAALVASAAEPGHVAGGPLVPESEQHQRQPPRE
jgi:replication initiation protein RepC